MKTPTRLESEKWLREYIKVHCPYYQEGDYYSTKDGGYEAFMNQVQDGYIYYAGRDLHSVDECDDVDELMIHVSNILGRTVTKEMFGYSCSC